MSNSKTKLLEEFLFLYMKIKIYFWWLKRFEGMLVELYQLSTRFFMKTNTLTFLERFIHEVLGKSLKIHKKEEF